MRRRVIRCSLFLIMLLPGSSFAQWNRVDMPADVWFLLSVDFAQPSAGAASGWTLSPGTFTGRAVYTTDSGATWSIAQTPDSARSLVEVQFVGGDTGYIAGAYNVSAAARSARHTSDVSLPPLRKQNAIDLSQRLLGIDVSPGVDYRGLFLETTDRGATWFTKGKLPDTTYYLTGMFFRDANLGFATGTTTLITGHPCVVKTTNGGESWTRQVIPDSLFQLWGIAFSNDSTGVAVGYSMHLGVARGEIIRTTNGGTTWSMQEFPTVNSFTDVAIADSATWIAVGNFNDAPVLVDGAVFRSTDGGISWSSAGYRPDSTLLNGVHFLPGTGSGIVLGMQWNFNWWHPIIARTTDYGLTWTETIDEADTNDLAYGGTLTSFLDGFVCGGHSQARGPSLMLRTSNGGVTGVADGGPTKPAGYRLAQNYPNPFNPTTTIAFSTPSQGFVSLTIHDLLGRSVATLVSQGLPAGSYSRAWNASGMSSGVYFYRLQAGSHVEFKKLVLLR